MNRSIAERLDQIAMSAVERRKVHEALRQAETLVDLLFAAASYASAITMTYKRSRALFMQRIQRSLAAYRRKQPRVART
jgi:hypothetical protein